MPFQSWTSVARDYCTSSSRRKQAQLFPSLKKTYQILVEGNGKTPCDEEQRILDHSQTRELENT